MRLRFKEKSSVISTSEGPAQQSLAATFGHRNLRAFPQIPGFPTETLQNLFYLALFV
jgi:hypothetical protein